ncbi:hypothetical protein [Gorillibacterium sp. sgz500922]|uniref:hypothetical protein n=1 Tax=Gorillibacterium sp. sgz500922 TaxID=3446694 RepID=UPI003F66AD2F
MSQATATTAANRDGREAGRTEGSSAEREEGPDAARRVIVSAPGPAGEQFIRMLKYKKIPFAVLINHPDQKERLAKLGVQDFVQVDTKVTDLAAVAGDPPRMVVLFEDSLNLTCRYLKLCSTWTEGPVYVISQNSIPRPIYRCLGAKSVIYSRSGEVTYLLQGVTGV